MTAEKGTKYGSGTPVVDQYTLKILHFGLMTIGTIGICVIGELTVRHISD
jgi:hypothetical protein